MDRISIGRVQKLTKEEYEPFGWVLGVESVAQMGNSLDSERISFWHEHNFDPGQGGVVEFLWVRYTRGVKPTLRLESHRLTEQAIIPLTGGPIIHVVCPPPPDPLKGDTTPALGQMKVFLLDGTNGVCMRRGCWHAQFPLFDEATCFMVTRRSTTEDIVNAGSNRRETVETVVKEIGHMASACFELHL